MAVDEGSSRVKTVYGYTGKLQEMRGVSQGEVLSPVEFVIFMQLLEDWLLHLAHNVLKLVLLYTPVA